VFSRELMGGLPELPSHPFTGGCRTLRIDLPAFAVSFAEQLVRGFVVRDLEVFCIPIERFTGAVGEVAQ
jgi:hypothetical protein